MRAAVPRAVVCVRPEEKVASPEALVVQASPVGHPGGVPAGVLLLIGAADLL